MPGVVSAFGVDASVVAQYIGGTAFSASTVPTATTVASMISRVSAKWSGLIEQRGVDVAAVAADPTSQLYLMSQEWIARSVALDVIVTRERAFPPIAEHYREVCDSIREEVNTRTAALLDGQSSADGAPGLIDSHVSRRAQVERALESMPLAQRLAWSGKL